GDVGNFISQRIAIGDDYVLIARLDCGGQVIGGLGQFGCVYCGNHCEHLDDHRDATEDSPNS
ncbi:MAG: hypothetical protein GX386_00705, partial [Clostridiaceae bacterium]|nr:hypothetical protein [Clostridiaceae bacterium]